MRSVDCTRPSCQKITGYVEEHNYLYILSMVFHIQLGSIFEYIRRRVSRITVSYTTYLVPNTPHTLPVCHFADRHTWLNNAPGLLNNAPGNSSFPHLPEIGSSMRYSSWHSPGPPQAEKETYVSQRWWQSHVRCDSKPSSKCFEVPA